jgi:hypothetical protein
LQRRLNKISACRCIASWSHGYLNAWYNAMQPH